MAVSKKSIKNNGFKLKGSLKKCGFDRWRYYFNGINVASGEERLFFIELMSENPGISYEHTVLPQTDEDKKLDAGDLQDALAGNIGNHKIDRTVRHDAIIIKVAAHIARR